MFVYNGDILFVGWRSVTRKDLCHKGLKDGVWWYLPKLLAN